MSILQAKPVTMILDTDTFNEIDDQFALVYALCSPEHWRVAGVTAAPWTACAKVTTRFCGFSN